MPLHGTVNNMGGAKYCVLDTFALLIVSCLSVRTSSGVILFSSDSFPWKFVLGIFGNFCQPHSGLAEVGRQLHFVWKLM